jgi:hypothetical protein
MIKLTIKKVICEVLSFSFIALSFSAQLIMQADPVEKIDHQFDRSGDFDACVQQQKEREPRQQKHAEKDQLLFLLSLLKPGYLKRGDRREYQNDQ